MDNAKIKTNEKIKIKRRDARKGDRQIESIMDR